MTAYHERPLYFAAGDETLFGVVTEPTTADRDVGVLMITGGGWIPGTHRNGMWVRLARRLAEHGFRSMRFDYHGVGESTGTTERFLLHEPYTADAGAALETFREQGSSSSVLVGTCFGGRTAADAAATGPRPAGVALLAVPILEQGQGQAAAIPVRRLARRAARLDVIRKLASAEHRRIYFDFAKNRIRRRFRRRQQAIGTHQSRYIRNLNALVDAGIPVLLVFGDGDDQCAQYLEARRGRLAPLFERAGDLIEVKVVPGKLYQFASLEAQATAIATVEQWLVERFPRPTIG